MPSDHRTAQFVSFLINLAWIFWFGGLTFYMAVVVPIGGDIIGSDVQGEITSVVTGYINVASMLAACLMYFRGRKLDSKVIVWSAIMILLSSIVLVWLRLQLLARMDAPDDLTDATSPWFSELSFYTIHRVYLWITTAQWICGLAIVWSQAAFEEQSEN